MQKLGSHESPPHNIKQMQTKMESKFVICCKTLFFAHILNWHFRFISTFLLSRVWMGSLDELQLCRGANSKFVFLQTKLKRLLLKEGPSWKLNEMLNFQLVNLLFRKLFAMAFNYLFTLRRMFFGIANELSAVIEAFTQ